MFSTYMTDILNGSLLPDDAPTDFELRFEGRDFQIIERDSIPRPPKTKRGHGNFRIAGLMLVPSAG